MRVSTFVLTPEVGRQLRLALLSELGEIGSEIQCAAEIKDADLYPDQFTGLIQNFDRYRAMLDAIGWVRPANQQPVAIDLDTHGWAFFTTLDNLRESEGYLVDLPAESDSGRDRQRTAERHMEEIEDCLTAARLGRSR